jgi:hypothetical protein
MRKKHFIIASAWMLILATMVFAQQEPPKFALVIGNGAYTGSLSRLANPVNDAEDMAVALSGLGFIVDKLLDSSLEEMEAAVTRLRNRLSNAHDGYGFFFYAGHGVQSGGENYLIPVNANIPVEAYLRNRAVSVQVVLDILNEAGNTLNVVVLDACRDNPFGWGRGGSRGLTTISRQPADSIIVYATGAGETASDSLNSGRNGLFTGQLLNNIKTPGLEVNEMFRLTGADVSRASRRQQIPAIYSQFFDTAFLGAPPAVFEAGAASVATGSLVITVINAGTVKIIGTGINQAVEIPAWGSLPIEKINAGTYRVTIEYEDGSTEEQTVQVGRSALARLDFGSQPDAPTPVPLIPGKQKPGPGERQPLDPEAARLNTVGISVGSAFTAPMFVGTVRGTYSPWRYSFAEIGLDFGSGTDMEDVKHFSVYPYARYALFLPFANKSGWYAGAGIGVMLSQYSVDGRDIPAYTPAADIVTGINILDVIDISYSLRTGFKGSLNSKVSAGWTYRFK